MSFFTTDVPGKTTPEMLEEVLQDVTTLNWYIVPIFVIVMYLFVSEIKKKHYNVVFGAAAFWLEDVFNETWNSMVYATTGQPVWGTTAAGHSALQILIGYNIEISFMFMVLGMFACKMLPGSPGDEGERFLDGNKDWKTDKNNMFYMAGVRSRELSAEERKAKRRAVLGRITTALGGAAAAVVIEILLNACNVLTWEKAWWQPSRPLVLFIIGYCPFFFSAYIIHDLPRKRQLLGLGIMAAIVAALLIVAGCLGMLGPQLPAGFPYMAQQ